MDSSFEAHAGVFRDYVHGFPAAIGTPRKFGIVLAAGCPVANRGPLRGGPGYPRRPDSLAGNLARNRNLASGGVVGGR